METKLIPMHSKGKKRQGNPEYVNLYQKMQKARRDGNKELVEEMRKELRKLPTQMTDDPHFSRVRYVRYADDVRRR